MKFRLVCPLLLAVLMLQGCIGAAIVGTAAIATKTSTDPRTTGRQVDDTTLELRVSNSLAEELPSKKVSRVIVSAYQGQILLIGQVPNQQLKTEAQRVVSHVEGVRDIYNELRINHPISFSQVTKDSWITTKIRSQLLTTDKVKSTNVKVITENGEVFLLGLVTHKQAQAAANIASETEGVKRVTTVFNFID